MGEKKITTVDELKKAYIQLKQDYESLFSGMLQMYQTITKNTENIMYIYDPRNRVAYINQKGVELLGIEEVVDFSGEDSFMKYIEEESKEEFLRMHMMIRNGDVKEITGITKLIHKDGKDVVYEHKLCGLPDASSAHNGVCFGSFQDITERYVKDIKLERYNKLINNCTSFTFTYDQKMDKMKVSVPESARQDDCPVEKNHYFWSKLIKDEQICPKADIPVLLDFIKKGSEKPIQIQLFDVFSESHRWYAISGRLENSVITGTMTDITDYKEKLKDNEKYDEVFQNLNKNFLLIAVADLRNDQYEMVLLDQLDFGQFVPKTGKYSELHTLLSNNVQNEYKDNFIQFGEREKIKKSLTLDTKMECIYKIEDDEDNWRIETIQVLEVDKNEVPTKIIVYHTMVAQIYMNAKGQPESGVASKNDTTKKIANILLVEDFALNAEYASTILKESGIEVEWVSSGEAALAFAADAASKYQFILMDTKMPKMNGFETTKKMISQGVTIPIIGMSLQDDKETNEKAKECGMVELLEKPITTSLVRYLIKKYVKVK